MLARPDLIEDLVQRHAARDTTARGSAMEELQAMTPRTSQWDEGNEIAEKSFVYRFAKKHWFNDFDAYSAGLPLRSTEPEPQVVQIGAEATGCGSGCGCSTE